MPSYLGWTACLGYHYFTFGNEKERNRQTALRQTPQLEDVKDQRRLPRLHGLRKENLARLTGRRFQTERYHSPRRTIERRHHPSPRGRASPQVSSPHRRQRRRSILTKRLSRLCGRRLALAILLWTARRGNHLQNRLMLQTLRNHRIGIGPSKNLMDNPLLALTRIFQQNFHRNPARPLSKAKPIILANDSRLAFQRRNRLAVFGRQNPRIANFLPATNNSRLQLAVFDNHGGLEISAGIESIRANIQIQIFTARANLIQTSLRNRKAFPFSQIGIPIGICLAVLPCGKLISKRTRNAALQTKLMDGLLIQNLLPSIVSFDPQLPRPRPPPDCRMVHVEQL